MLGIAVTTGAGAITLNPAGLASAMIAGSAMSGADAVICAIGPASNRNPGTLISVRTRNLVAGCIAGGITRFVFESGPMVSDGP